MSSVSGAGVGGVAGLDLSSMDLETALMAVQSQRAQMLEDSLRMQLDTVNARNAEMAGLNESMTAKSAQNLELEASNVSMEAQIAELKDLQGRLAASKCPNPEGWYGLSWGQGDDHALSHATLKQIEHSGLALPTGADAPRDVDGNGTMDAKGRVVQGWVDQISGKVAALEAKIRENAATVETNKNDISAAKNEVDKLGNTQQMEMMRLQSMTGKRNEAFDLMSSFLKKAQDSKSSIIGNMR
jgi:chromosome segregation ATPase